MHCSLDSALFVPLSDVFDGAEMEIAGTQLSEDTTPVRVAFTGQVMRCAIAQKLPANSAPIIAVTSGTSAIVLDTPLAGDYTITIPASEAAKLVPDRDYVLQVDTYTAGQPNTVQMFFWSEFRARRKVLTAPTA